MRERLRPSDYRFLTVCLLLLAATVWFSVRYFHHAFPEASIDFRVNREQARDMAQRFLAARGYNTSGYREAARFSFDDHAKRFLEREAGLETANRIMGSRVRLWQWSNRWFRAQQKEEFSVAVTPRGEVVAFAHEIPEDAPRPSLPPAQARAAAEEFLRTVLNRDPAALDFVEGSSLARPARTDHVFTWKERSFEFHDATYRIEITVRGREIGAFREYLKVPEQWLRGYDRLRSRNQAAQSVDTAVMMVLLVGLLISLVICVRGHDVRWREASLVGMIGGALFFLSSWNEFPLTEFYFPTTDSYSSLVVRQVINSILGALAAGGLLFALTAAAEPLYRHAFSGRISLGNLFRPAALRTRSFFLGTVLGISLTGIFVAYQIAFYMLAYRFGAWSPADVPYSDLLNTRFPWATVLFGGFLPAVSEEFLFRMFAIPFLKKVFRWMWVALIVAGFLWGFGHSGYPQQPFYIRGLEVGIGGVALGLVMLRWGILPTLVWHYSVDAMYTALLLMRSGSLYFQLSGAASAGIMLLPALLALAAYVRYGGFEPETGLTNAAVVGEEEAGEEGAGEEAVSRGAAPAVSGNGAAAGSDAGIDTGIAAGGEGTASAAPEGGGQTPADSDGDGTGLEIAAYRRWSLARRAAALATCAGGLLLLAIPVSRIGDKPPYQLGAEQARTAAGAFLRSQQDDPSRFRDVVSPASRWGDNDALAGKYLLERRPAAWVAQIFEKHRSIPHWRVRYFRELDKEEWLISLHPQTGAVTGFNHEIPEDRPGADLPAEAAVALASSFAAAHDKDLSGMDLKETRSEKKKARRDYTLVWEARPGDARNLDEARYRVEIEVAGDRVASARNFWKIPETYERTRSKANAISIFVSIVKVLVVSLLIVGGLIVLIQRTRHSQVPWSAAWRAALPFTLLAGLGAVVTLHLMWRNYSTAIPAATFQVVMLTGAATSLLFVFLVMCAAVALIMALRPGVSGVWRQRARRTYGIDAVLAALAAIGLSAAVHAGEGLLQQRFHAQAIFSIGSPDLLASLVPAVSGISGAARSTLLDLAGLALLAYLLQQLRPRWTWAPLALLALAAMVPGDARTGGEFALGYCIGALPVIGIAIFCRLFARDNWLAYALAAWTLALRGPMVELLGQPNAAAMGQGWALAAILAASLGWCALPAFRSTHPRED
jgi:membrane protease YdiL (CAAX protease family)